MAGQVEAGVDGEATEPGIEPVWVTQPRQISPGSDEGLLDRVAGQLRVPEDEPSGPVQRRGGPAGKLGEGVMIACPRLYHESSLVHGPLERGTPWWSCSNGYGVGIAELVLGTVERHHFRMSGLDKWLTGCIMPIG